MKILGLIPARGGSKGIPNKNRKELGGKPLMQYTIEAALGAKYLSRVVFSSEDSQLREMAKTMGAEVPFARPEQLATDRAGSLGVVQHAIVELNNHGEQYDAVCLLQVTTPFRNSKDIDRAIEIFKDKGHDSLISVQKVPHQYNPHWVFEKNSDRGLTIATGEEKIITRRQELPDTFIRDGAIYITKTEVLMKQNSFFGNSISSIELNSDTYVNIDTEEDWIMAERILEKHKI